MKLPVLISGKRRLKIELYGRLDKAGEYILACMTDLGLTYFELLSIFLYRIIGLGGGSLILTGTFN